MTIKSIAMGNRESVVQFFKEHWGSAQMIISTGIYDCDQLDGFIYKVDNTILGLLTYVVHEDSIEVISLDSIKEGHGIGTKLMNEVELFAKQKGINKITLITTNDNNVPNQLGNIIKALNDHTRLCLLYCYLSMLDKLTPASKLFINFICNGYFISLC